MQGVWAAPNCFKLRGASGESLSELRIETNRDPNDRKRSFSYCCCSVFVWRSFRDPVDQLTDRQIMLVAAFVPVPSIATAGEGAGKITATTVSRNDRPLQNQV
jgi:hypothetical protein